MTVIQIVLILFSAFAFSRALLRFRRGDLPFVHLLLWFFFWLGVVIVALRPGVSSALAHVFGVGRGADMVIYLALMVLFFLVFRMFGKIEDLERQITRVVRAAALEKLDGQSGPTAVPRRSPSGPVPLPVPPLLPSSSAPAPPPVPAPRDVPPRK